MGTVVADGTEQVVVECLELARLVGYIDLGEMSPGDTVVIRQYMRLKPGGRFKVYESETYTGPQTDKPIVYVKPKESDYGVRVTLQQTSGVFKSFDYNFLREV
jgi:hypothetical protein